MELPHTTNQRWSLDFVPDMPAASRILCVVDDFSRERPATVVDTSLSRIRGVRELDRLIRERATPMVIVNDDGAELTSIAVLKWAADRLAWVLHPAGQTSAERLHRKVQ